MTFACSVAKTWVRGSRLRERGSRARVTGSEGKGQRVRALFYITRKIGHSSVVCNITKLCDLFGSHPVPVGGLIHLLSSVEMHLLVPINALLLFDQTVVHEFRETVSFTHC